jgi:hypothetical protein
VPQAAAPPRTPTKRKEKGKNKENKKRERNKNIIIIRDGNKTYRFKCRKQIHCENN